MDDIVGDARMVELSDDDCLSLLAACDVGRIAVVHEGFPVVFPVNYQLIGVDERPAIALRTRPGNSIDHPGDPVAFQIDGLDAGHDTGWSVLVRGRLVRIAPHQTLDPRPFIHDDRDAWRLVLPHAITGRRLLASPGRWPFHPDGYL